MARMKSKFIKGGNGIFYVDKTGRKWDKKCLDELFETITERRKTEEILEHYPYNDTKIPLKIMKKLGYVFKSHKWE